MRTRLILLYFVIALCYIFKNWYKYVFFYRLVPSLPFGGVGESGMERVTEKQVLIALHIENHICVKAKEWRV